MAKGMAHFTKDGTPYYGEVHKMPDGSIHSGKTHTKTSIRATSSHGDVENIASFGGEHTGVLNKVVDGKSTGTSSAKSGLHPLAQKYLNNLILKTPTVRWAKKAASDPRGFAENIAKEQIDNIIKGSKLYKKITMYTQITPIHLLEIKAILKNIRG